MLPRAASLGERRPCTVRSTAAEAGPWNLLRRAGGRHLGPGWLKSRRLVYAFLPEI